MLNIKYYAEKEHVIDQMKLNMHLHTHMDRDLHELCMYRFDHARSGYVTGH